MFVWTGRWRSGVFMCRDAWNIKLKQSLVIFNSSTVRIIAIHTGTPKNCLESSVGRKSWWSRDQHVTDRPLIFAQTKTSETHPFLDFWIKCYKRETSHLLLGYCESQRPLWSSVDLWRWRLIYHLKIPAGNKSGVCSTEPVRTDWAEVFVLLKLTAEYSTASSSSSSSSSSSGWLLWDIMMCE